MANTVKHIGLMGASDVQDRNCRNWPLLMVNELQVGNSYRIRHSAYGYEGQGSTAWIAGNYHLRMAQAKLDVAVLSFFADGAVGLAPDGVNGAFTRWIDIIDLIRDHRADVPIFLLRNWRMDAATEASTFAQLAAVYAKYTDVVSIRDDVTIIDVYAAWGDPDDHPEEYDVSEPIHPLLAGHIRVTIPTVVAALTELVT
jgi:hypothetical protein